MGNQDAAETEDKLCERNVDLEAKVRALQSMGGMKPAFRKRSQRTLWGWPLYDIAVGPDLSRGEWRGCARGIIAIGDIAIGGLAIGGAALGGVALGGVSAGLVCIGGCALGVLLGAGGLATGVLAFGGLAVGGLALGGLAAGGIAVGGLAIGYYAVGDVGRGQHVLSTDRQDPEAVRFFTSIAEWVPGLSDLLEQLPK